MEHRCADQRRAAGHRVWAARSVFRHGAVQKHGELSGAAPPGGGFAVFPAFCGGVVSTMAGQMGGMAGNVGTLPGEISAAIGNVGFLASIPLWLVTILGSLFITVLSFILIMTVYSRFFKIYIYAALAPVPIAAFGSSETAATGKAFLKGYVGVCLQGAVIVLSCLIFSAYMGSGSPAAPSGSAVSMVWTYVTEIIFNMLVLVGLVKSSDRIVREMMGLRGMRASLASCNLSASRTQRS